MPIYPLLMALTAASAAPVHPINAVVGDASWIERYGHAPTASEQGLEDERHVVHLAWIERRLRAAPTDHLDPERRAMRAYLLDALHAYTERGAFPVNEPGVVGPRFIDDEGTICAVGYLIEVSAGRELAELMDERHEHEYLLDIDDPELSAWIGSSGLSAEELASIQPVGYAGPPIDIGYVLLVGLLAVPDLAFLVADVAALTQTGTITAPALSIGQIVYGVAQLGVAALVLFDALDQRDVNVGQLVLALSGAAISASMIAYSSVSLDTPAGAP